MHGRYDPRHRAGKGNQASQPADPESATWLRTSDGEVKRKQDDPGESGKIEIRKAERIEETARAGEHDLTGERSLHRAYLIEMDGRLQGGAKTLHSNRRMSIAPSLDVVVRCRHQFAGSL